MATSSLAASWRSFWHTMTSDDRHASPDSPYRSGAHVSLGQSRHSPLTTVTSAANDSRADLTPDEAGFTPSAQPTSPQTPYKPGMRTLQRQSSHPDTAYAANGMTNGDMPMQSFADGLPPPPPVAHTWERIDSWLEDNYEELYENLGEGCTINDVNELEHELDASLPQDVRESLMIHDGQERGGRPTGVLFSCMLLDCEEIVQEWKQWARTNDEYLRDTPSYTGPPAPIKAFAGSSNSARTASPSSSAGSNWRQDLLSRQDSQPANAVRKAYVHPAWIPLARDWGGNNICVDLAPGPTGQWGQVILMGRDYDCKYVVARSWGTFLANIADDMATSKWFIDEDTHELKLREFPRQNVEPAYIDILRWRADQKYGRRFPPRDASAGGGNKSKRPMGQQSGVPSLSINSQVNGGARAHADGSPYSSPTTGPHSDRDRGRSPTSSFAPHSRQPPAPSPLSRVTEESSTVTSDLAGAPRLQTHIESPSEGQQSPPSRVDRLISVDSPVIGASAEAVLKQLDSAKKTEGGVDTVNGDQDKTPRKAVSTGDGRDAQDNKENLAVKVDPKLAAAIAGAENELKTIEI